MTHLFRSRPWFLLLLIVTLTALAIVFTPSTAAQPSAPDGAALNLSLQTIVPAGELAAPVDIAHAGDDRLFVVERAGRVRIVRPNGSVDPVPFLDITDRVSPPVGERGLLGLTFHPNYAENGAFYVNYTAADPEGATHISRFSVSADPDVADPGSEQVILEIAQPAANHNAGDLVFSPLDGYLYIPLGDGGGTSNDSQNRAQNMSLLLGKVLRIDVDGNVGSAPDCGTPGVYTVPVDNPFIDGPGGDCDEIWAVGLRNPWRASFDRQTGDFYMGDVGERAWEEIDRQPASSSGGENYGWPCFEGSHVNVVRNYCEDASAYAMPIFELGHDTDIVSAVTGGYVYRGQLFPEMFGRYFLSDLSARAIWDLEEIGGVWQPTRHDNMASQLGGIVSFGEDRTGELYLARITDGAIYRLTEDTLFEGDVRLYVPLITRD